MLSPSDFNNAVPQFTNGDYASNPINPQYIAEPDAVDYNKGAEPLQTLPAQWWNWFINRFTNRFNKVNIYVKNIFNELTQLLSLVSETPSGTESTPTVGQMKDMFETKYPDYLKTTPALSNTYVPQTTRVNGHELCENITITCVACAGCNGSGTAFGTAATKNTGTAAGCIPIVGTALGTTNGQFIATDASGCLKPSGYSASSFRASTWTPSLVNCSCCNYIDAYTVSADRGVVLTCAVTAAGQYQTLGPSVICKFTFNPVTGEVKAKTFTGTLAGCACCAGYACYACDACYACYACVANAKYCAVAVYVCFKYMDSVFGNCCYDICVCSRTGTHVLVAEPPSTTSKCCSSLLSGKVVFYGGWHCIGCAFGKDFTSYVMGGVVLG